MQKQVNLEMEFQEKMIEIYEKTKKECGYNGIRFFQMVCSEGGLITARKLVMAKGHAEGLTRLWYDKRLDLSMEATIIRDPWCNLFTNEELAMARKKLKELGYYTDEKYQKFHQ